MEEKNKRFHDLELFLTILAALVLAFFVIYIVVSFMGLLVLKIICAVFLFALCGFGLWILYVNKELFRQRSLWLTCSFCAAIVCTLVSLLAGYPCP